MRSASILTRNKPYLHSLSTHIYLRDYKTGFVHKTSSVGRHVCLEYETTSCNTLMWRHSCDRHDGHVPEFVMNVAGTFHNDAILRQIIEAVMISKFPETELINSKSEWNYAHIPRTVLIDKGIKNRYY